MPKVFEETKFVGIRLKNRTIRTATHEGICAADSGPSSKLTKIYTELAEGGVGAIITGITGVRRDGKIMPHMMMIDNDSLIPAYRKMTDAVHKAGVPVFLQLGHAGRQTDRAATGVRPVAPSAIRDRTYFWEKPRQMTEGDIFDLIEKFADGVIRAKEAGFDGVQFHAAHGYLFNQFLSSYMNRRKDSWGGSLINRSRFLIETIERSRKRAGDFPLLVRLNAVDNRKGGIRPDEAVETAKMLEKAGADALDISCGVFEDGWNIIRVHKIPTQTLLEKAPILRHLPGPLKKLAEPLIPRLFDAPRPVLNYNLENAGLIKKEVSIPIITAGGIRSRKAMEKALEKGDTDYIGMSRPFLREPDIVNRLMTGQSRKSLCISCGLCFLELYEGEAVCVYA